MQRKNRILTGLALFAVPIVVLGLKLLLEGPAGAAADPRPAARAVAMQGPPAGHPFPLSR